MPFTNEVIGSNGVLIRNWLQSQNYVPGQSGWQITKNGNAEFNGGTFRGSLEVGPLTGQHFIVNNASTNDVIDIYDSSNRLVYKLDQNGTIVSLSYATNNPFLEITSGSIAMGDSLISTLGSLGIGEGPGFTETTLASPALSGGSQVNLQLVSESSGNKYIICNQRGQTGTVIQSDSINANQLIHVGAYNVTTDAGGTGFVNHGCAFTPTAGFLAGVNGIGANFPYQYAWFASPFTSTTAKAAFKDNTGAALANTTLGVFGFFFG
jgi:hypothetical protein